MIGRYTLYGVVLGLGCANALIRPVMGSINTHGIEAVLSGFGITFVIWGALYWSLSVVISRPYETPNKRDYLIALAALLGFLYPSATVCWLVVGLVALSWRKWGKLDGQVTVAFSVIIFASLRDPLASLALKLFATPLLDGDALLASLVMAIWDGSVSRSGNLITGSDGHQLLILTGCTSYTNLSIALLAWFTLSQALVGSITVKQALAGAAVTLSIVVINIGRLALMGIGPNTYRYIHDGDGAIVVDIVMVLATLMITAKGCGYGFSKYRLLARI